MRTVVRYNEHKKAALLLGLNPVMRQSRNEDTMVPCREEEAAFCTLLLISVVYHSSSASAIPYQDAPSASLSSSLLPLFSPFSV
jgi:hypothetical protein